MKKIFLFMVPISAFFVFSIAVAKHFWRGELMPKNKVCQTWGTAPFDSKAFKGSSEETKATMACSLLEKQKQFIGKDTLEIRAELGNYEGHYFSDMFPTYMIYSAKSRAESSWQIVFLIDRNQKISEVVVHKNCCD